MTKRSIICLVLVAAMAICPLMGAFAAKDTTLTVGSEGEVVRKVQQALIDLSYLKGKADGIYGAKTEEAVRRFQSVYGLTADGLAGTKTQNKLFKVVDSKKTTETKKTTTTTTPSVTTKVNLTKASSSGVFKGNYDSLRSGDKSERVRILESCLIALKCMTGKADATFDNKTFEGVRAFQTKYGLSVDGIAGRQTLIALENLVNNNYQPINFSSSKPKLANGEYLCRGDRGEQVTLIQQRLQELGYKVKITGKYDETTRKAVIDFQERNKILVDGVVGVNTLKKMYSKNAVMGSALK